jgi:hypothetical protein
MEITHDLLHLRQMKFCTEKDLQVLSESMFHLTKLLNMAMVWNIEVMLRQTLNLSVEFCNFVQCHTFFAYFH